MPSKPTAAVCLTAVCLAVVLCSAAGCSDEFEHERLDKDATEFADVQAMLDELRAAGKNELDDVLARQVADGLDKLQEKPVRYVLAELAKADSVALKRVDRWGSDLYRATIQSTSDGATDTLSLLLVHGGDGKLRWAKTN